MQKHLVKAGREHIDCENTIKMKIANRKSQFDCAFCLFLRSSFHFHNVFQRFWMPFCSKAAQKLLRRPSEAVEVWVSSGRLWRSSGRPWESSGSIYRKTPDQPPLKGGRYLRGVVGAYFWPWVCGSLSLSLCVAASDCCLLPR